MQNFPKGIFDTTIVSLNDNTKMIQPAHFDVMKFKIYLMFYFDQIIIHNRTYLLASRKFLLQ